MSDLLTVQLTPREARALHSSATLFSQWVSELCPDWEHHVEPGGEVPALSSGILALEATLMLI